MRVFVITKELNKNTKTYPLEKDSETFLTILHRPKANFSRSGVKSYQSRKYFGFKKKEEDRL